MNLNLILKGFIVGIAKIIPGVSGSILAMTLGIYEALIEAIINFFSNPKKHIKLLLNFGIGVLLAIILFSKIILLLLDNYYHETMYLFLGLILGTMLPFIKQVKFNKKNTFIFIVFLCLMFLISNIKTSNSFIFNGSVTNYIYISFLGLIDAFSMIVPGVSGTAIYMLLGAYEFVLEILSNPFSLIFIIYAVGLVIGVVLTCYLINYLLKKRKEEMYSLIFAFMVSSVLILFLGLISSLNIYLFLIFGLGIVLGYKLDKY